ncbi:Smr/MutS family protein [Nitrosomonas mobilis]|uniref:Smr domain n=1 Tax=Nitrosomonas mobilis TaxID=51642 RepID=A0A1G5SE66_9PROT|nr:Smr/MutS family protein [Nitrosomonas mobilis]SCZ85398.1 Smr domain [Nitrosomonas mobilis]HNO74357.1 Smr/MutS family protein [Nitrosomonas mobilis]
MDDDELSPESKRSDDAQIEEALFREAVRDVRPLKQEEKIGQIASPALHPAVSKRRSRAIGAVVMPDTLSDHPITEIAENADGSFIRPGLQRQTLRRLRRGDWPVQAQLDLHGLTRDAARRTLAIFLMESTQQRLRCVRIIHGKGFSSTDREPVLKKLTGNWLAQHESVLAFCQARPENGGSGALEVLLKKHQLDHEIS